MPWVNVCKTGTNNSQCGLVSGLEMIQNRPVKWYLRQTEEKNGIAATKLSREMPMGDDTDSNSG